MGDLESALYVLLLFMMGPLFLLASGTLIVQLVLRLARRAPRDRPRRWRARALTAASVGASAYSWALWTSGFGLWLPADEICGVASSEFAGAEGTLFPPHQRCVLTSGAEFDLVPWWIDPVLALSVVATVGCLLRARRTETGGGRVAGSPTLGA